MMAGERGHIERTKESRADDSYAFLYTLRGALREGCRLARLGSRRCFRICNMRQPAPPLVHLRR